MTYNIYVDRIIFVSYLTKERCDIMINRKIPFEIKMLDNMINRKICNSIKKINISHTQASILRFLYNNQDKIIYQNDIEKEVDVRRSTISGILDTMEKNNLITRKASKKDARKKEIALTIDSLNKHKEIDKKIASFEDNLLKGIDEKDLIVFINVIDKLKENLK